MNILVCFKALPDYQMVAEQDWQVGPDQSVDVSWARQVFNCYEESALELALQLAGGDESGFHGETTALTIDDDRADFFFRQLYATGYDHGVRIDCGPNYDLRFNPLAISLLIATYLQHQKNGQQLVLLGSQGGLGDHRQTGYLVAERLGWPCIGDVVDVAASGEPGVLQVTSRRDRTVICQTVALPLVLVIGNVQRSPYLRVPTLRDKLVTKTKTPVVISPRELSLPAGDLQTQQRLISLERPRRSKECTMITGATSREKAQSLFATLLTERLL